MFEQEIYSERWSSRVRSQVDKSMICKIGEDVIRSLLDESRSRFETDQRNGGILVKGGVVTLMTERYLLPFTELRY